MEKFGYHVPCIDNLCFAGFRQNRILGNVKLFGDNSEDMVGQFSNLRHSVDGIDIWVRAFEQNGTPRV
jgi:hypothetical protein